MPTALRHFRRLRGMGVFGDYAHATELLDFRRFNLVYGFNGSGKTTLSRVIRSIEIGATAPHLPSEGEFVVDFADGTAAERDTLKGMSNRSVVVFNEDFVDENLSWRDGKASAVYFIGKEQTRLAQLVDALTERLSKREHTRAEAERAKSRSENEFRTFKTNLARLITEELNLGRHYNATQLDRDYASSNITTFKALNEQERREKKALINKLAPGRAITALVAAGNQPLDCLQRVRALCEQSIAEVVIADLQAHPTMLNWVREGLEYHEGHSLSTCLFCGNGISAGRFSQLAQCIDDRFAESVAKIEQLKTEVADHLGTTQRLRQVLPARSDFDDSLGEAYQALRTDLFRAVDVLEQKLSSAASLLDNKARTPNLRVAADTLEIARVRVELDTVQTAITRVNGLIAQHNDRIARFDDEKEAAATALKLHHLAYNAATYKDLDEKFLHAESDAQLRARLQNRLRVCIERVQGEVRSHGPAVAAMNKLLASYLGHNEIALAILDDGYQIQRHGNPIEGPLSEGEKTAIALCYFLSKLEENGRKKRDLTVMIDDPISSLDSRALNYAFCLLRTALEDVGQLILLTHNLQFMNEAKKWLKPLSRDGEGKLPTAALYFIDVRLGADGKRSASIKPLPKLLREYDSEYHYLFSLILAFVTAENDNAHLGYVLPNVLRKILELFLMFKMPGSDGLGSKLKNEYVRDCGIGEARVNALYRLVEVESHGDNLDDLISFSSMSIEETRDAANALLALMEKLDSQHLGRMKRLCG